jgi:hypothetical protein
MGKLLKISAIIATSAALYYGVKHVEYKRFLREDAKINIMGILDIPENDIHSPIKLNYVKTGNMCKFNADYETKMLVSHKNMITCNEKLSYTINQPSFTKRYRGFHLTTEFNSDIVDDIIKGRNSNIRGNVGCNCRSEKICNMPETDKDLKFAIDKIGSGKYYIIQKGIVVNDIKCQSLDAKFTGKNK